MFANALGRLIDAGDDAPSYPASTETERAVRNAHLRDAGFQMQRVLRSGGYAEDEIEAIVAVLKPFLEKERRPSAAEVRSGLVARGFGSDAADIVAQAFER